VGGLILVDQCTTLFRQSYFTLAPANQTNKDRLNFHSCFYCSPIVSCPIVTPLGNPDVLGIVRGRSLIVDIAATGLQHSSGSAVHHHLYNLQDHSSYESHLSRSCNLLGKLVANKAALDKIPSKRCFN
jgi:hypothetical protein